MVAPVRVGGTPAPAARRHDEAPTARLHLLAALTLLLAASLLLALRGAGVAELRAAFPLLAGAFVTLILGTTRLLVAGMAGRDVAGGGAPARAFLALAAGGAILLALWGSPIAALPLAAALVAHAIVVLLTLRRPVVRPPIVDVELPRAALVAHHALEGADLAYGLAAAVALPLAYAGRVPMAVAIHLLLVGFVLTTILAVALRILPRFSGRAPPAPLVVLLAPLAAAGPALVAFGLAGSRPALALGVVVEGAAVALFAGCVAWMLLRARRERPTFLAYAAAIAAIALGGALAWGFSQGAITGAAIAAHGVLNTLGFAGLFVLAASSDIYAPAMRVGAASAKRHVRIVLALGLAGVALAAGALSVERDAIARSGLALYALAVAWHLAGAIASHRRAGKVLARVGR